VQSRSPLSVGIATSILVFACCCIVAYSAGAVQSYLTPPEVKSERATATAVARETATAVAIATLVAPTAAKPPGTATPVR
jgi:hypothetical protein